MPTMMRPGRLAGQARGLLRCGMWAGPVFAATFLAEGAVRDGYRPLRHPVSSLALGPRGRAQTANFAVTGALCLAGAAGLRLAGDRTAGSRTGPVMVAAAGAGLIASAAFRTDPVGGYPPGTPDMPATSSRAGTAHNLAALPVFLGLPAAAACYGWRRAHSAPSPAPPEHPDTRPESKSVGSFHGDRAIQRPVPGRGGPDADIGWHVLADPEGNEFCAFTG